MPSQSGTYPERVFLCQAYLTLLVRLRCVVPQFCARAAFFAGASAVDLPGQVILHELRLPVRVVLQETRNVAIVDRALVRGDTGDVLVLYSIPRQAHDRVVCRDAKAKVLLEA